jgi:AcrR family transcriptional regulator
MGKPRYRRRKEDRPQEITEAAFEAFAEKGFAATRVEEVAERAGVSKGLMYLYFRTKEELLKAVIKSVVIRRVDRLIATLETTEMSSAGFMRGPMADFMKQVPGSRMAVVIRLLLSEGPRHPDLIEFYWRNVVSRGLAAISGLIERGVERGEFHKSAVGELPQLFVAPVITATIWRLLFDSKPLNTDRLIDLQIELLLDQLEARPEALQ